MNRLSMNAKDEHLPVGDLIEDWQAT